MPLCILAGIARMKARKAGKHSLADLLLDQKWVEEHAEFVKSVANGSFFKELERHSL